MYVCACNQPVAGALQNSIVAPNLGLIRETLQPRKETPALSAGRSFSYFPDGALAGQ